MIFSWDQLSAGAKVCSQIHVLQRSRPQSITWSGFPKPTLKNKLRNPNSETFVPVLYQRALSKSHFTPSYAHVHTSIGHKRQRLEDLAEKHERKLCPWLLSEYTSQCIERRVTPLLAVSRTGEAPVSMLGEMGDNSGFLSCGRGPHIPPSYIVHKFSFQNKE